MTGARDTTDGRNDDDPDDWLAAQFSDDDPDEGERESDAASDPGSDVPPPRPATASSGFTWGLRPSSSDPGTGDPTTPPIDPGVPITPKTDPEVPLTPSREPAVPLGPPTEPDFPITPSREPDRDPGAPREPAEPIPPVLGAPDVPGPPSPTAAPVEPDPPAVDPALPGRPDPEQPDGAVLTMQEVLDAPSPRRAAREAAAREAAAAAPGKLPPRTGTGGSSPSADEAETQRAAPVPPPTRLIPPPVLGSTVQPSQADDAPPRARAQSAPPVSASSGVDSLFGDTGFGGAEPKPPGVDAPSPRSSSGAADDNSSAPIEPAARTAPVIGAAPLPVFVGESSTNPPAPGRRPRAVMTATQKLLFGILAVVIVAALVVLAIVLFGQGSAQASAVSPDAAARAVASGPSSAGEPG